MKEILGKLLVIMISVSISLSSCITTRIKPLIPVGNELQGDTLSVKIFLLERDIPNDIDQLGVVSISVNSRPTLSIDAQVKRQLRKDCQQMGANGAYRINDGTYYPTVVSYVVFRYKK
ncbi:hypothetical protein GO730_19450 [Spirosoma sp. HMF3257]|uniref:Lipoprotein n=1 Tax=Spirosoma telluris TaxID=2183553 RepID=A0A327NK73_9BACT|nr:hypothetical protein [Spirosoma telluris]RAI75780.1 hypothetical protein HMF3257_19380 [Spirosoma telluris]